MVLEGPSTAGIPQLMHLFLEHTTASIRRYVQLTSLRSQTARENTMRSTTHNTWVTQRKTLQIIGTWATDLSLMVLPRTPPRPDPVGFNNFKKFHRFHRFGVVVCVVTDVMWSVPRDGTLVGYIFSKRYKKVSPHRKSHNLLYNLLREKNKPPQEMVNKRGVPIGPTWLTRTLDLFLFWEEIIIEDAQISPPLSFKY